MQRIGIEKSDTVELVKKNSDQIKLENESVQLMTTDKMSKLQGSKKIKPVTSTQLSNNLASYIAANKFLNTTSDVLIIGPSGSGKSLLLRRIKNMDGMISPETQSTIGTDLEVIEYHKRKIVFREVGFTLVNSWFKFYSETKIIMYVVDITSYIDMAASVIEFYNVLVGTNDLETPIMLIFNKADSANMIDFDILNELYSLISLKKYRENLEIMIASASTGINIQQIMDHISTVLDAFDKPKKKICCLQKCIKTYKTDRL